ncbi:hypothetical protein PsYK624_057500 [Phanerochaete sordida]|uniref:Uncharacterized protein n=1 Tax=Phanerochaete sordida TaxID=48140 RepID=A0A9P3G7C0_9APHY|nr:hypothetical protein PsYK624_057500 [Phanerochaete sordida]
MQAGAASGSSTRHGISESRKLAGGDLGTRGAWHPQPFIACVMFSLSAGSDLPTADGLRSPTRARLARLGALYFDRRIRTAVWFRIRPRAWAAMARRGVVRS